MFVEEANIVFLSSRLNKLATVELLFLNLGHYGFGRFGIQFNRWLEGLVVGQLLNQLTISRKEANPLGVRVGLHIRLAAVIEGEVGGVLNKHSHGYGEMGKCFTYNWQTHFAYSSLITTAIVMTSNCLTKLYVT